MKVFCFASLIVAISFTIAGSAVALDTTDDGAGIISARGENSATGEGAAKAFDNSTATKWLDFSPEGSWIQYQYASSKRSVVTEYTLTSANDFPARDPMDWNILGSNDGGASWVTLDTRTNQTFANRFQKLSFSFANTTAFNIYRLEITKVANLAGADSVQLAEIELIGTIPALPVKAVDPSPADNAINVSAGPALSWTAGTGAQSHDVYFGTAFSDVNGVSRILADLNGNGIVDWNDISILTQYWLLDPAGTEPYAGVNGDNIVDLFDYAMLSQDWMNSANQSFKGNQVSNNFNPGELALETTYYWRVDEVNGPNAIRGDIWSFTTQSGRAYNPNPANSASGIGTNPSLSWSAGAGAISHDVYFGTANPPAPIGNQSGTTYNPGILLNSKTYYWRIDEVGSSGTLQGDLWSFTTQALVNANRKKGPYLIYPGTNTEMTVLWQIDATTGCTIEWGTTTAYSSGSAFTTEYGSDHQHKYNITGLTPGTKYYYRVTIGSNNYTGSFNAAPASDATAVKFFMYGDTRTNVSSNNTLCGRMNSKISSDPAFQTMVLHAGDWVESAVETTWTNQWFTNATNSTAIYTAMANMPFMGCVGNHEGSGTMWKKYFPYNFYNASRYYYSFDYGPVHVTVLDQTEIRTGDPLDISATQQTWMTNDLHNSTKPIKIVVLHHPGWSCGGGHNNSAQVRTVLQPIFVQEGVNLVLAGHNHYYSRADVSGIHHLTSGGGGAGLYTPTKPADVQVAVKSINYQEVTVDGSSISVTTYNGSGAVIDGPF